MVPSHALASVLLWVWVQEVRLASGSHSALQFADAISGSNRYDTLWREGVQRTGNSYCVRVILDMDARTLSFDYNGKERLAFSGLPEAVHPYIVNGNAGKVFTLCRRWIEK